MTTECSVSPWGKHETTAVNVRPGCLYASPCALLVLGGACTSANVSGVSNGRLRWQRRGGNAGGTGGAANTGTKPVSGDPRTQGQSTPAVRSRHPHLRAFRRAVLRALIGDGLQWRIDCGNNCPTGWTCDPTQHYVRGRADCNPTYQCHLRRRGHQRLVLWQDHRRLRHALPAATTVPT